MEELISEVLLPDARGRVKGPLPAVEVVRSLIAGDLPVLQSKRAAAPDGMPRLKQLRHAHHQLARLLASGQDQNEIALITGYSPCYISTIKNDPQFAELMATYAGQRQLAFVDVLERMKSLGLSCMEELQERIADDAGSWSNREMMELAELLLIKPHKAAVASPAAGVSAPAVSINVKFVGAPESATMTIASSGDASQASTLAPVRLARLNG